MRFPDAREHLRTDVGGGSGIRTHVTVSRKHAFQACAFSHSATPPDRPGERAAPVYIKCSSCALALLSSRPPCALIEGGRLLPRRAVSPSPAAAGCRGAAGGAHYRPGPTANNSTNRSFPLPTLIGIYMFLLQTLTIHGPSAQYPQIKPGFKLPGAGCPRWR